MKERNNPRKDTPVEYSNGKFHKEESNNFRTNPGNFPERYIFLPQKSLIVLNKRTPSSLVWSWNLIHPTGCDANAFRAVQSGISSGLPKPHLSHLLLTHAGALPINWPLFGSSWNKLTFGYAKKSETLPRLPVIFLNVPHPSFLGPVLTMFGKSKSENQKSKINV